MKRHEVKISSLNTYVWVACEVIGTDEDSFIVQYLDLDGVFYEETVASKYIREVTAVVPDEVMIEAAMMAANHIKEYLIFANGDKIEEIAYQVFNAIDQEINSAD